MGTGTYGYLSFFRHRYTTDKAHHIKLKSNVVIDFLGGLAPTKVYIYRSYIVHF